MKYPDGVFGIYPAWCYMVSVIEFGKFSIIILQVFLFPLSFFCIWHSKNESATAFEFVPQIWMILF